ncbi:glycosyl transferases group 1 [mine drainage metagenome]|uniref:Glycosyl transferases group 1 n=1 Tax=mine drainage metagenome TaxID=410659 RepID=A0A1J5PD18_9ZZZZ
MLDEPYLTIKPVTERKYDLVYVASDNIHNIRSSKWFFEKVYPLLPAGLKIGVIGKINHSIADSYNIERVLFTEDLGTYYNDSKIAICPMLQGTGVKVKVIEAMAYGLPVVCTSRGADGLPNKQDNGCLVSDQPIEFAENIIALLKNELFYDKHASLSKAMFNNNFKKEVVFKILDNTFND